MKLIDFVEKLGGKVKIKGLVTEIYKGEIQKGKQAGQAFYAISLDTDDKLYVYGDDNYKLIKGIREGETATFTVERQGKYLTITEKVEFPADGGVREPRPATTKKDAPAERASGAAPMTERFYKNRISALSAAVEYLVGDATADDNALMDLADQFFNWIQGDGVE